MWAADLALVGGDGAIARHFGRPRDEILQLWRESGDVRRGGVHFERVVARESFDEREVGRVVGVLQELVLQAAGLGARGFDQRLQDLADSVDGVWTGAVAGEDVDGNGDRV